MRVRPTHFFLVAVILVSVFGAGAVDVLFNDVIPIRPYDGFFRWTPQFQNGLIQSTRNPITMLFTVVLIILILGATAGALANSTTGIVTAHTGFTPNINLTSSPGVKNTVPVLPLVFIGIGLGFVLDEVSGIL